MRIQTPFVDDLLRTAQYHKVHGTPKYLIKSEFSANEILAKEEDDVDLEMQDLSNLVDVYKPGDEEDADADI